MAEADYETAVADRDAEFRTIARGLCGRFLLHHSIASREGRKRVLMSLSLEELGIISDALDSYAGPVSCRVCGCTDDEACPGGCEWVENDLCSAHGEGAIEREPIRSLGLDVQWVRSVVMRFAAGQPLDVQLIGEFAEAIKRFRWVPDEEAVSDG